METLKLAVMSVIRFVGESVSEEDFVRYFSYTKNWIPPEYSRRLFRVCVEANLLKKKGDRYVPNFEFSGVIPLDFRVTEEMVDKYSVQEDIFTIMLDKICREKGMGRREALMEINRIKKEARYITTDVATLIYCRIVGVDCSEYYDIVEKKLVV